MKGNNTALIGLGIVALLLLSKQGNSSGGGNSNEKYFNVPGVGPVQESQLGNYGYVFFQGQWIPQQLYYQIMTAQQGGGNDGWGGFFTTVLNTGLGIFDEYGGGWFGNNNNPLIAQYGVGQLPARCDGRWLRDIQAASRPRVLVL